MSIAIEGLLVLAVPALGLGAWVWSSVRQHDLMVKAWPELASRLGLPYGRPGFGAYPVIEGERRGHELRLAIETRGAGKGRHTVTTFQVRLDPSTPAVEVQTRGLLRSLLSGVLEERQTGDANFDTAVSVTGPEAWAVAALDADARKRLALLLQAEGWVNGGKVMVEREGALHDVAQMQRFVEVMLDVAVALHVPDEEVRARLSESVQTAPTAAARTRALRLLCEAAPDAAEARDALAVALGDPSAEVRFAAAQRAGEVGAPVLAALALSDEAPAVQRAEALEALAMQVSYAQLVPTLRAALVSDADALRAAALALVTAQRDGSQQEEVWMALERGGELTLPEAARAMGVSAHPRNEDELVRLLHHDEPAVRLASVESLGLIGTSAGLDALGSLHTLDPRLLLAARLAKQQIRERLGSS